MAQKKKRLEVRLLTAQHTSQLASFEVGGASVDFLDFF